MSIQNFVPLQLSQSMGLQTHLFFGNHTTHYGFMNILATTLSKSLMSRKSYQLVGMVPYNSYEDIGQVNRFFLVEKFGLDMGLVAGVEEPLEEE